MTDSTLTTPSRAGTASLRPVAAVTAVVVTHGVSRYLATTLAALAAQTRAPGRVLVVNVASEQDASVSRAAGDAFAAQPPDSSWDGHGARAPEVLAVHAPGARTFGDAVQRALAGLTSQVQTAAGQPWLWLLHDDSAPEPSALAELVRAVEKAPSVAIAGVKQRTWTDPPRLLEVGVRTSRSGRRMTGIEDAEVDQGQHDGRDDVLGVGIAGALVRRDVWDALGGTDPALGAFGDGLDLSRRARLAGHRVVVVPSAAVRHAQAGYHGLRDAAVADVEVDADSDGVPDSADPRRSFAARRRSLLHQRLTSVPLPLLPVIAVLAVVVGAIRSLVRVTTKEPALAVTELGAPFLALSRLGAIARSRTRARATRRLPRRALRPLQATWRDVWAEWRDRRLARAEARKVGQAPSELEMGELAGLASRRRVGLGALAAVLVGVTALALGQVLSGVVGGAALVGPALVPSAARLADLWAAATSGWVPGGLGAPGPADALLVALVPGTAALGSSSAAVAGLLLGAVVLAGVGAWFAAGAATRSVGVRAWAGIAWAAAPALLLGLGEGRIGAVLVHVMLPWVGLGLARAIGVQRVDTVVSGLVTARRRDDDVVDDPDLDADWRAEVAAHRDEIQPTEEDDGGADRPDHVAAADHFAAAGDAAALRATARADRAADARGRTVAVIEPAVDQSLRVGAPTPTGSLAAAAGAALAFAAVVAGAPALIVPGVLVLLAVALCAPRGRVRVLLVPLPALLLLGPTLVEAAGRGAGGLRLLLADPGPALSSVAASPVEQLLGVPASAGQIVPSGLTGVLRDVWPLAVGGAVLLLALLALLRGSPVARGVRVAWLAAAAGLAVAAVAGLVPVAASDGGAVHGWPGSGLSFAGAGLLAAAVIGTDGLSARLARSSFGWRQPAAVLLAVVVVAAPVATLGAWSWQARTGDATRLTALDRRVVPAVGQQAQASPTASRVLALTAGADGVITWQLLRGDGPQLLEESAAVRARGLSGSITDATIVPADAGTAEVEDLVARLGSGSSGDVSSDLSVIAVADVLVPPATGDANATARAQLVGRLDSTAGLERITANSSGVIWRVQPATVAGAAATPVVSSWARLVTPPAAGAAEPSGQATGATDPVGIASDGRSIDTRIPAGTAGRLVVLAERADAGWHATLDGHPLRSVSGGWRQTFEVGADGGRLVVELQAPNRVPWLVAQGVVGLLTLLLAIPVRRRKAGRR
ncbi:glycosyl transferase family 2 [Cellulomonas sp. WB94]|uniref:glycosyltransferase n=1 Tax=Cellulomonas sp. WB94 TaxID=2173174 RepID=UPI000D56B7E2|nr:glycosyltransferase [Cellulomonas sp. WB94]PVU82102.1 glycosyl transferase family 2 [Cellulomonas sp. WB94]